ncbi:hypothetical protein [Pacificoceanicola onchidii]|uniref:hypothetical protein n=1 Tax=Pacificoceanicola onchidii TaxID=2562685 RepID=UPI001F0D68AA|nr:hypothetical protein [Pacificoceanicola onchidii]
MAERAESRFSPVRAAGHTAIFLFLTLLTQIGGLAWLLALLFKRRVISFCVIYVVLTLGAVWIAPLFGRVAISCLQDGPLRVQSGLYCALNRTYVTPEMADVLKRLAEEMERRHPGTQTLLLDANFPFIDGFPLLPHLSHKDGKKADIAFYYSDETGYAPGATRSPIGYFAFEEGPTQCPDVWPTLRWDFAWLQPMWRSYALDEPRLRSVMRVLTGDDRIGKVFLEPHLVARLGFGHKAIRFQGCRAARHDDHVHFQLK